MSEGSGNMSTAKKAGRKEELQKTEELVERSYRQGQEGTSWEHM
jgi:hypothetical protein